MTRRALAILLLSAVAAAPAIGAQVWMGNAGSTLEQPVDSWMEIQYRQVVKQQYDFSCGAASMATLLRYFYNEPVTEKSVVRFLLEALGLKKEKTLEKDDFAFSFTHLKAYANKHGYKAVGLALPIESLRKLQVPAILYLEIRGFQHFVVFKGIDKNRVYLADPSFGNRSMRIGQFKEAFYTSDDLKYPGKALVLIPRDKQARQNVNHAFMVGPDDKNSNLVDRVFQHKTIDNVIGNGGIDLPVAAGPLFR